MPVMLALLLYPGVVNTPLGADLVVAGEHFQLSYFASKEPMRQVARFYVDQWTREGYPVTVDGDMRDEGVVSAFQTREGRMLSVVLRRDGARTLGFGSVKDLRRHQPAAEGALLASAEGAEISLVDGDLNAARAAIERRYGASTVLSRSARTLVLAFAHQQVTLSLVGESLCAVERTWGRP